MIIDIFTERTGCKKRRSPRAENNFSCMSMMFLVEVLGYVVPIHYVSVLSMRHTDFPFLFSSCHITRAPFPDVFFCLE
jgi:hypothetical protein